MGKTHLFRRVLTLVMAICLIVPIVFVGPAFAANDDDPPKVGNEHFQKALELFPDLYNPATNGTRAYFSDTAARVIQEAVWIETPLDTDFDGKRDLMRVLIRRPIETRTHGLKVPAICNISPYVTTSSGNPSYPFSLHIDMDNPDQGPAPTRFTHTAFRGHDESYNWGTSTTPADQPGQGKSYLSDTIYGPEGNLSYEALAAVTARRVGVGPDAVVARHRELIEYDMLKRTADQYTAWHYENFAWLPPARTPTGWQLDGTPTTANPSAGAFGSAATNIPRGIACLQYRILGSDWAEGFLQYGMYQESIACAAIVDWLNGRVRGYTDATGRIEVEAYWSTGEMGASGTSFEGTCPIAAAATGVEGLRTIAPGAPVTNSYSYYRENGMYYAPGGYAGEDLVNITWYCIGRFHTASSPVYLTSKGIDNYWSWQRYLYHYTDDFTGDYTPTWEERNPLAFMDDMRTDIGVIQFHGINDDNVKFKNTYLFNEAMKHRGVEVIKGSFHQGAHAMNNGRSGSWTTSANMIRWVDHYLWGIDNGIVDSVPNYEVESNVTANTYNRYDEWPVATEHKKFYPTGGRVGVMKEEPQVRTVTADFRDNVVLRLTRPVNNDAFYVTTANSRPAAQRDAGLLREYRWHTGQGVAIAAAQRHRWRNALLTGEENNTTAWGAALSGTFATAVLNRYPVSPSGVNLNTTNLNIQDRLLYTIPIPQTFVISGTVAITAEVAPTKNFGILTAIVLEKAENGRMRVVARGSVDVRNPNPDGTLHKDVPGRSNVAKGGGMYPSYMFAAADITPGEFYSYTWEMDATEYTFRAGREIVLMFCGADPDFTKRPITGTGFTVNIGPRTFLQLPINGYTAAIDGRTEFEKAVDLLTLAIVEEIQAEIEAVTSDPVEISEKLIAELAKILEQHRIDADAASVLAVRKVLAYVTAPKETYCGDPIPYTVSLAGVKEIGTVKLNVTVDTANQKVDIESAATALNGFTMLTQKWTDLGGGVWKGALTLMYPSFVTAPSPFDILKINTTALGNVAPASVTISDLEITGSVNEMSGFLNSEILGGQATTGIVEKQPIYSKFDLNHDGAIDILDTNIAVFFYLKSSSSAGWATEPFGVNEPATAQDADVNGSGRVDLADLIEIMVNYRTSYDIFPY